MARFIKTPELWEMSKEERQKLQPGQWVTCGGSPGRWAGICGPAEVAYVTHFDGRSVPMDQFKLMVKACKN